MDALFIAVSLAVVALVIAPVLYATTLALRRDDGRLRLFEVLRGQGLPLPESASEASVIAGAHAVRRCVGCSSQESCDRLAAQGDWQALAAICPNHDYIDRLRAEARVN